MNRYLYTVLAALSLATIVLAGCQSGGQITPPPDPRRPAEIKANRVKNPNLQDCQPVDIRKSPASLAYRERSITEAKNLANQGFAMLQRSEERSLPRLERERYLAEAVDRFITALLADPYNVHATYNLAAAYARIGRAQCSVNLLERLVQLRKLRSQSAAVEEKLDHLLGRNRVRLDPDFLPLRDMDIFRELVRKLGGG